MGKSFLECNSVTQFTPLAVQRATGAWKYCIPAGMILHLSQCSVLWCSSTTRKDTGGDKVRQENKRGQPLHCLALRTVVRLTKRAAVVVVANLYRSGTSFVLIQLFREHQIPKRLTIPTTNQNLISFYRRRRIKPIPRSAF